MKVSREAEEPSDEKTNRDGSDGGSGPIGYESETECELQQAVAGVKRVDRGPNIFQQTFESLGRLSEHPEGDIFELLFEMLDKILPSLFQVVEESLDV